MADRRPREGRAALPALLALIGVAAALRLAAAANDLWLDEIWSLWLIAREAEAPWDVFRGGMRHDNNHLLNSLYLFCLPTHLPPLVYRLVSVAAGTIAVWPAWLIGRQRSAASGWWCGIAVATSHILVNCSSEARGYALMSLFLLTAQWAALEAFDPYNPAASQPHRRLPVIFGSACVLGLLSHLSFVMGYLGVLGWTAWVVARRPISAADPWPSRLRTLLFWHAVPLSFAAILYGGFVRGMVYGGGPRQTLAVTITKGLAALSGATQILPMAGAVAGGIAIVAAICLAGCFRDRPQRGMFFVIAILVAPAAILAAFPISFYSVRYLLVPLQTLLILMASELAMIATTPAGLLPRLALAIGLMATGANLARDAVLVHRGRGEYRRMLRLVKDATAAEGSSVITIGSNHDLRTHLLVAYHQEGLAGRPIRAFSSQELPAAGADWFILNHMSDGDIAPPMITDRHGNRYRLAAGTRSGGLSETHWHLYRREPTP